MGKTLGVAVLALIPVLSFGSVVYSFDQKAAGGDYGFTLTEPDYVSVAPGSYFSFTANMLSSCDMSANPIYVCQGGNFTVFQDGYANISFGFMDPHGSGFGATSSVTATFQNVNFGAPGTYSAFDGGATGAGATFSIVDPPDASSAPEPGTIGSLLAGLGVLGVVWKRRHRHNR